MLETKSLGIKETGYIDKRYNRPHTASYSLFQCPVCNLEFELATKRGRLQNTCKACRGTQNATHGMSSHKVYSVWLQMHQRCTNPKNKKYSIYGGKGITVSDTWSTFEGFWADMGSTYEDGMTIDRMDSSRGYSKENCRWLTLTQNSSETTKLRPVIQLRQVLTPTKHYVEERSWESAKQAADSLGLVAAHITVVCQGTRKTHGGFNWKYATI